MFNWQLPFLWKLAFNMKWFWRYKFSCTTSVEQIFYLLYHWKDEELNFLSGQQNLRIKTSSNTHVEHGFRRNSDTTTMLSNILQVIVANKFCFNNLHWFPKLQIKSINDVAQHGLAPPK